MSDTIFFYKDRPLFGMDIGASSVKVMQIVRGGTGFEVTGYGTATFEEKGIQKGVVVDFDAIAGSIYKMFQESMVGAVTTKRVAISVPAAYTFSRIISLPGDIAQKDMPDAVLTETQQYLPTPVEELYTDFSAIDSRKDERRILSVAVPRKIIDSYMKLAQILDLEVVAMEPTTGASNRLFGYTDQHKVPSVLIDFGAISTDITIYDNNLVVTGTVSGGGDHYTEAIKKALDVTQQEAHTIKTKYGLNVSKKQSEIRGALQPFMNDLIKEVRRMIRYYEERVNDQKKKIGQVVTLGGGSYIPGLSDYLTETLRLPVRNCDPWDSIAFSKISPPAPNQAGLYITAAGLSILDPKEPFA